MDEQIRNLTNEVKLSGRLLELTFEVKEKSGEDAKKDYLGVTGLIQYGETEEEAERFKGFFNKYTVKGTQSKKYDMALEWVKNAIPATKDKENASYVTIKGHLVANDYVNREEKLIEAIVITADFFGKYDGENSCQINLEAVLRGNDPEIVNDVETGRNRLTLLGVGYKQRGFTLKRVIVPKEFVSQVSNLYSIDDTALFRIDYKLHASNAPVAVSSNVAFGEGRSITSGKNYSEYVLVGADVPLDEDNGALSKELIKGILAERKAYLDEIKNNGYKGAAEVPSSSTSNSRTGIGSARITSKPSETSSGLSPVEDDDDMPF